MFWGSKELRDFVLEINTIQEEVSRKMGTSSNVSQNLFSTFLANPGEGEDGVELQDVGAVGTPGRPCHPFLRNERDESWSLRRGDGFARLHVN